MTKNFTVSDGQVIEECETFAEASSIALGWFDGFDDVNKNAYGTVLEGVLHGRTQYTLDDLNNAIVRGAKAAGIQEWPVVNATH